MILSAEQGRFQIDGKNRFLLADTVWSALGGATEDEWAFYLQRRARQGFNAALLSVLPILHDRSLKPSLFGPFDEDAVAAGTWRFDPRFFATLRQRLDLASESGIVCGLVLLWVNYVEEAGAPLVHRVLPWPNLLEPSTSQLSQRLCTTASACWSSVVMQVSPLRAKSKRTDNSPNR